MEPIAVHVAVLAIAKVPEKADLATVGVVAARAAAAGHRLIAREVVEDTEMAIRDQLEAWIANPDIDVVIAIGTADSQAASAALRPLVAETIPGFTDLFRLLAFQEIGAAAMLSNAEAARCGSTFVFVLPASIGAAGTAMEKLILPQLDSRTTPRNLVMDMPRLQRIPQEVVTEKTEAGLGMPKRLPAKTGKHVILRKPAVHDDEARADVITKPIALAELQRELEASGDTPTRPNIELASLLPRVPPGADDIGDTTEVTEPAPEVERGHRATSPPAPPPTARLDDDPTTENPPVPRDAASPKPGLLGKLELKSIPVIPKVPKLEIREEVRAKPQPADVEPIDSRATTDVNEEPAELPPPAHDEPPADPKPRVHVNEAPASDAKPAPAADPKPATRVHANEAVEDPKPVAAPTSASRTSEESIIDASEAIIDDAPPPPTRKPRPITQPPPPPAKRAPTTPPPAATRRPTTPPPVLTHRDDDLPRGKFNYPVHRPASVKRILLLLLLAVLAAAAGVTFVHFVFDRPSSAPVVAQSTPPPAPTPPPPVAAPVVEAIPVDAAQPEIEIDVPAPTPPTTPRPRPVPQVASHAPIDAGRAPVVVAPDAATVAAATPDPAEGCDEVSCVLDKYARPCCEHFRPAAGESHAGTPDTLDRVMVHAGVQSVMPRVIACGEKITSKGTVKIAMKVGADGKVREVSVVDAPVPALGDCVAAALRAASFGKSVNGVSFTYPFVF